MTAMEAPQRSRAAGRDQGIALLLALLSLCLLSTLGLALVLVTTTDLQVAANYRDTQEAFYAAESGLERALDDLLLQPEWNDVLAGERRSAFVDGAPAGTRTLVGGTTLDLGSVLNRANCGKAAACTAADMDRTTTERPWGVNNPRYQLFAYGPLSSMSAADGPPSRFYVVVMVGDDGAEQDGDPARDSDDGRPGGGIISLQAEAFGPGGAHARVDATVARTGGVRADSGYAAQSGSGAGNRNQSTSPLPAMVPPVRTRLPDF
jgi:hypothetical protein